MNKYFPLKPLAKDLCVVKKTVRKGAGLESDVSSPKNVNVVR